MKTHNLEVTVRQIGGREVSCIVLGESGRGRMESIVLADSPLGETANVILPKQGHPGRPKIINSPDPSNGWLVRIHTGNVSYCRNGYGHVSAHPSLGVKAIACGWGAYGAAGRVGRWQDVILQAQIGSWVRVKPAWGDPYIMLFGDNNVYQLTYEEARALSIDLFESNEDNERTLKLVDI